MPVHATSRRLTPPLCAAKRRRPPSANSSTTNADEKRVEQEKRKLADAVQAQRLAGIGKGHVLNQRTLAGRLKVGQAHISEIEHGSLHPHDIPAVGPGRPQ